MKLGRAGHNRKKPKEQKVNEHSFPWLPYLTPLFSTHTSCYSAPFVLSVRSSSRAEQERAVPRHVLAVTHRSRASALRGDAAGGTNQPCRARHKNVFTLLSRPSTARLRRAHACAETLSWQPPHHWWAMTKVTRTGESGRADPSVQNSSSVPCLGTQALRNVQLLAIYHLGIWMLHWLTSATCILSSPCATA